MGKSRDKTVYCGDGELTSNCACCGKRRKYLDDENWCDECNNIVTLALKAGKVRPPKQRGPRTDKYKKERDFKNRRRSKWYTHSSPHQGS